MKPDSYCSNPRGCECLDALGRMPDDCVFQEKFEEAEIVNFAQAKRAEKTEKIIRHLSEFFALLIIFIFFITLILLGVFLWHTN